MPTEAPLLRRWAMECAAKAGDPNIKPAERARLLKMRDALVELAKAQEWLDRRKNTPTQQQQQIQPRRKRARPKVTGSRRPSPSRGSAFVR